MNDEERMGRQPWMPTQPMWGEREVKRRKEIRYGLSTMNPNEGTTTERYRMPDHVKAGEANDLKRRFAKYLGEPKKATAQIKRPYAEKRPNGGARKPLLVFLLVILLFAVTAILQHRR